jgi:hypothetical protein
MSSDEFWRDVQCNFVLWTVHLDVYYGQYISPVARANYFNSCGTQDLASKIAQQLGVSPDTVKVSTPSVRGRSWLASRICVIQLATGHVRACVFVFPCVFV